MRQLLPFFFFAFAIVHLSSCEKSAEPEKTMAIETIGYGTSFGECLGYCIRSITITNQGITLNKRGWDLEGMLPDSARSGELTSAEWSALIDQVNFESFLQLDTIIGCPGCADGGAEWIEITKGNQSKKVVFEYLNAPEALNGLVDSLRMYMNTMDFNGE